MKKKNKKVIDGYKLRTELARLIPNYSMDIDNDGQIIIYTNLTAWTPDAYAEMDNQLPPTTTRSCVNRTSHSSTKSCDKQKPVTA